MLSRRVLPLSLALLSCSHPQPAPRADSAPSAASAAQPDAAPGARTAKAERLLLQALTRVPELAAEVARLRGVAPLDVVAKVQSQADFRTFLLGELDVELPAAKSREASRALAHIGLLEPGADVRTLMEQALLSQAGAYYDPRSREFRIVLAVEDKTSLDGMIAHEIAHAYQDRDRTLEAYLGGRGNTAGLSEDVINARRFIVEGEATLIMTAQMTAAMTGADPFAPAGLRALQMQTRMMAGMDADKLAAMSSLAGSFVDLGPEMAQAMRDITKIPPYVLWPLTDAYMKGAATVLDAYVAGGWSAVDALRQSPPESTEQVLHTAKLLGERDRPVALTLPELPPPWVRLGKPDTLGELLLRVYFRLWGDGDPSAAAGGWDGDRWAVYADGERLVGLLATAWDAPEIARSFAERYGKTLEKRGHKAEVTVRDQLVLIVDGCDRALCPEIVKILDGVKVEGTPGPK